MEWSKERQLLLTEMVKNNDILWNPFHPAYYDRNKKKDGWKTIADELHVSPEDCQRKFVILRGSYRREKSRIKRSEGTGKGAGEIYISKWFAYEAMSFIDDKVEPRNTINSLQTQSSTEAEEYELDNPPSIDLFLDLDVRSEDTSLRNFSPSDTSLDTEGQFKKGKEFKSPLKRNDNSSKVLRYLDKLTSKRKEKDEVAIFGELVLKKLRKIEQFDLYSSIAAQQQILKILSDIELSKISQRRSPSISSSSIPSSVSDKSLPGPSGSPDESQDNSANNITVVTLTDL